MNVKYDKLVTEKINKKSNLLNQNNFIDIFLEDHNFIFHTLKKNKRKIFNATKLFYNTYISNNKIFFLGAGTSGRLGVIEATEMKPTFGVRNNSIIGLMAGGNKALSKSIEGAEDDEKKSKAELKKNKISKGDLVIGISASGTSKYVLSAINYCKLKKIKSIFLTCNPQKKKISDIDIIMNVGSEILAGSTRLKSGTVTKIALNMITTSAMLMAGKSLDGLMLDIRPTTDKLKARCINNLSLILKVNKKQSEKFLIESKWNLRIAIIMYKKKISYYQAKKNINNYLIEDLI